MDDRKNIAYEAHARPSPPVIPISDPSKVSSKSPPGPDLGFPSIETRAEGEDDAHLHLTPAQSQNATGASAQTRKWRLLQKFIVWKCLTEPIES